MACSIECFQEYMDRIEKSRNSNIQTDMPKESDSIPKPKNRKKKNTDSEMISENIIIEN